MNVSVEQLLQLYGESQVNVRLLEMEIRRLTQENEKPKGEDKSPPPGEANAT